MPPRKHNRKKTETEKTTVIHATSHLDRKIYGLNQRLGNVERRLDALEDNAAREIEFVPRFTEARNPPWKKSDKSGVKLQTNNSTVTVADFIDSLNEWQRDDRINELLKQAKTFGDFARECFEAGWRAGVGFR